MTPSETLLWGICSACGNHRMPIRKEGRYYAHRGVLIEVPENHPISRCATCHKDHLEVADAERLVEVLEASYQAHTAIIEKIKVRDPRIVVESPN